MVNKQPSLGNITGKLMLIHQAVVMMMNVKCECFKFAASFYLDYPKCQKNYVRLLWTVLWCGIWVIRPSTSASLLPTTKHVLAFLWAFHPTSTATNGQFSWTSFPITESEDKGSSLKSECSPRPRRMSYHTLGRMSVTGAFAHIQIV